MEERQEFRSYEEYRGYVLDKLDVISRECLNLEIQTAQIQNDPAARGAMAAVEFIRKDTNNLLEVIKKGYNR